MGSVDMIDVEPTIILGIDDAFLSDDLAHALEQQGFSLIGLSAETDIVELFASHQIDGLLAGRALAGQSLDVLDSEQLLVLILSDDDDPPINDRLLAVADAIVLAHPHYLIHQLKRYFKLHQQKHRLEQRVCQLQAALKAEHIKSQEIAILKNAIVHNVSHELKTPLLQVKSAISLIAEDGADAKLLHYAQNATAHLESRVKNITMLGQSLNPKPTAIILRDVIVYAKRNIARIWTRKQDEERIDILLDDDLPPIYADRQGMNTILQALIDNALKFGNDSHIQVIGRLHDDETVYVAVRDFGIGIDQAEIANIWDSFYQVDGSSTRRYGGSGIGLALVKLILDYHNIDIQVDSELGAGSTFWFTVPIFRFDDDGRSV